MASAPLAESPDLLRQRELYYFTLFRCLEAALLVLWVLSPLETSGLLVDKGWLPAIAIGYLILASAFMIIDRLKPDSAYITWAFAVDLLVFASLAFMLPGSFYSCALLMLVNLAAGGLLLDRRFSLFTDTRCHYGIDRTICIAEHYREFSCRYRASADVQCDLCGYGNFLSNAGRSG